jgi:molybdopterin-guanine dinucleotide biosynthesis protein A
MRNERAIVVACDMPFLNLRLLRHMAAAAPGYDVVVPWYGGEYEPLHAIYGIGCKEAIETLLAEGPQRIVHLYQRVRVRVITEDEVDRLDGALSFFNVNTPDDWVGARRLSAR